MSDGFSNGKRKRSPIDSNPLFSDPSDLPDPNGNGYHLHPGPHQPENTDVAMNHHPHDHQREEREDGEDEEEEGEEEGSEQDQEEAESEATFASLPPSRPRKQRPKTTFGGSKRRKGKGKSKKDKELALRLASEEERRQREGLEPGGGNKSNRLHNLQRPLLELDRIDHESQLEEEEEEEEEEREGERLWLREEDRTKLLVVIESLDPTLPEETLPSLTQMEEDDSMEQPAGLTIGKALTSGVGEEGVDIRALVVSLISRISGAVNLVRSGRVGTSCFQADALSSRSLSRLIGRK